jgi:SAM-dependent methyltransferase
MVWCLAKLYYGCHKPVILFGDFWDDLIESFQKNMYIDETELGVLYHARTKEDVLRLLQEHELKIKSCVDRNFSSDEAAFVLGAREKLTKTTYNKVASSYHAEHAGKLVAQEQLDEFMSMVNPPAQVLDIGAGPGYDIKYLSEKYSVKGLEVSERFTQIARYENPGIDIELGDVVTLDIGINKYKGIWARDSIHHIPEEKLDIVFKKVADALVEEGIFYAIVREGEGEITENESKNYANLERFYHLFTADELTKRAEKAGLKLVKIDHSKRSHKWLIGVFKK